MKQKLLIGLVLSLGMIGLTGIAEDSEAQSIRNTLLVQANRTVIAEGDNVTVKATAVEADGDFKEDIDSPPQSALIGVINMTISGTGIICYDVTQDSWIHAADSIPTQCQKDMTDLAAGEFAKVSEFEVQTKNVSGVAFSNEDNITGFQAVVFDWRIDTTGLDDSIVGGSTYVTFQSEDTPVTEAQLALIGPEISGFSGSQLLEMAIWFAFLGISLYNNWIWTSIISVFPLFGPVFRNAGAAYPVNFVAGVFLVTLSLFLEKYAAHWGDRFKGWLRS